MGFNAELVILYPERNLIYPDMPREIPETAPKARRGGLIWEAQEILQFGRVTRLAKVTDKKSYGHLTWMPRQLAAICVVSCLFRHLGTRLKHFDRSLFAPEFFLYQGYEERDFIRRQFTRGVRLDLTYCQAPVSSYNHQARFERIGFDLLRGHNERIHWPKYKLMRYLEKDYHVVRSPLFLWESCTVIAKCLEVFEEAHSSEWVELQKEPTALALVKAWRAYLKEIGRIGTRALFVFPR